MALREKLTYDTIDQIDYQSKISRFLFGRKTPPLITRIAFIYGLLGWFYFFIWYLAAYLSIAFIDSIEHPEQIKANFNKIGLEYGLDNFQITLSNTLLITLICLGASLVGLFLIYRRKIFGYYIYLGGWIISLLIGSFMLGFSLYWKELINNMDKAIILTLILPYIVLMLVIKKSKEKDKY